MGNLDLPVGAPIARVRITAIETVSVLKYTKEDVCKDAVEVKRGHLEEKALARAHLEKSLYTVEGPHVICLEESVSNLVVLYCNHTFCFDCLKTYQEHTWEYKATCPYCR